jgi:2-C-methyl-D-erythritol 4-phosphate cytidylyltransferase
MGMAAAMIPDLGVVVVGGGSGSRFGGGNKLLAELAGLPVFLHSVRAFLPVCPPGALVLVVPSSARAVFQAELDRHVPHGAVRVVDGGDVRAQSVRHGLAALPASAVWAAIHDAARPLADAETLRRVVAAAREHGGAVAARKVTDTLKEADAGRRIVRTVDRRPLWAVETPQVFPHEALDRALAAALARGGEAPTDDAGAMEALGQAVWLCEIRGPNPKVTVPEDLRLASALMVVPGRGAGEDRLPGKGDGDGG